MEASERCFSPLDSTHPRVWLWTGSIASYTGLIEGGLQIKTDTLPYNNNLLICSTDFNILYFRLSSISRSSLNGLDREIFIEKDIQKPRGIALHPQAQ